MRLLKLWANRESFRTVEFNRSGLSLIIGEQRKPKTNKTSTYNGVGKSLIIQLLRYCLGSNTIEAFQKHLRGWEFYLDVEIHGKKHTIGRSAANQTQITLDGTKTSLTALKDFLEKACFEIQSPLPYLTFGSLISPFVRSGPDAYTSFFFTHSSERAKPYGAMLRNAFFLGLDLTFAKTKYDLRSRQEGLRDTVKKLEKDPLFADLLAKGSVDIELTELKEQAAKRQADLSGFRVAEDYHDIEKAANDAKRQLDRLRRDRAKIAEAVTQIDQSLQTKGDLPKERVFQLYEEARLALPGQLRHRVESVLAFQKDLQRKRIYRLTNDKEQFLRQQRDIDSQIRGASADLDAKLEYLGKHNALDEYVAVTNTLSEIQRRIAKLEETKAIRDRVSKELKRIDRDWADQNIQADDYLTRGEKLINEANSRFRSFAKELYGDRASGLTIKNDIGDNQLRYSIEAHIKDDAAEGINEVRIFCYDMMLWTLRHGHAVDFCVHDSTLFGPVDPRQRLGMFQIADRICRDQRLQYIASLNMHDIVSIRNQVGANASEVGSLLDGRNVVLTLTDESDTQRLLGISVDMNYRH